MKKFELDKDSQPQTYGLGIKELWRVKAEKTSSRKGCFTLLVWPLDNKTYGGSFIYHLEDNQVAIGFVVGLDYQNPYLETFPRNAAFKNTPND